MLPIKQSLILFSIAVLSALIPTAYAADFSTGFAYPTGSVWTNSGNWLAAGVAEYQDGKYHVGRDITAVAGSKVYALAPGHVVRVYTSTSDAVQKYMWFEFDLADGSHFYAVYGHINSYWGDGTYYDAVSIGQEVATIADYPPYGSTSGDHLHLGIRPAGVWTGSVPTGWGRGSIPAGWDGNKSNLDTNGFVSPWDYLSSHRPAGSVVPADIWWTSTPTAGRWYRSNEYLAYSYSGTDVNVSEDPHVGGFDGMYLAEAGLGWHGYSARAWNSANDKTITWTGGYDTQAPDVGWNGDCAPAGTWLRGTQYATWHWTDALAGIKSGWCRWNGGSTADGGSGIVQIPEGKNTLQLYVEDNAWAGGSQAGNSSTLSAQFWLDNGAPTLDLTAPATSTWLNASAAPVLGWTASDATSGVQQVTVQWDAGEETAASGTSIAIPDGIHSATVRVYDNAGNVTTRTAGPFWVDTVAPALTATVTPVPTGENNWYLQPPTLTLTATDATSGLQARTYALDGGSAHSYSTPVTLTTFGAHDLTCTATDIAGNVREVTVRYQLDMTKPAPALINLPAAWGSLQTLAASWTATDPDSGISAYAVAVGTTPGGAEVLPLTGTDTTPYVVLNNLLLSANVPYYFTVYAKNAAGLWSDPASASTMTSLLLGSCDGVFTSGGVSGGEEALRWGGSGQYALADALGQFVVGESSLDLLYQLQHGYLTIGQDVFLHPADTDGDGRIIMAEALAYALAWKKGQAWTTQPSPIPMAYAVNAALIWKRGELYHYDPTYDPPFVPGM